MLIALSNVKVSCSRRLTFNVTAHVGYLIQRLRHQRCARNISGFNFLTVVCGITAMISFKFISFSAVQIYDISYIH